jgi:hypothetical protein
MPGIDTPGRSIRRICKQTVLEPGRHAGLVVSKRISMSVTDLHPPKVFCRGRWVKGLASAPA